MKVSPVSFGLVTAVSGNNKKIQQLRRELDGGSKIARVDLTDYYKKTYSNGLLAQAVRNNQTIDFYVTGEDFDSYTQQKRGWKTLNDVACQLDAYYDLNKNSISFVKEKIKEI